MVRKLLTGAVLLAAMQPVAWADEPATSASSSAFEFGWCGEPDNELAPLNNFSAFGVAIGIDATTATKFDGCKITKIQIAKGILKEDLDIEYYISSNVTDFGTPVEATLTGEKYKWNEFTLPEPYVIKAGEPVYAGWFTAVKSEWYEIKDGSEEAVEFPIVTDFKPNMNYDSYYYLYPNSSGVWDYAYYSMYYGAACIRLVIEGENMPVNDCTMTASASEYADAKNGFEATVNISNIGVNEVKSVEVSYAVGDQPAQTKTLDCDVAAITGVQQLPLVIESCPEGVNVPVTVELTKVNGNPVAAADNRKSSFTVCAFDFETGFGRTVVVEGNMSSNDATGFGPESIVAMENLYKENTDVIGIMVHNGDDMAVDNYAKTASNNYGSVNRIKSLGNYPASKGFQTGIDVVKAIKAFANVSLSVKSTDVATQFVFEPTIEFALDVDMADMELAYVVIEDEVGPYTLKNIFYGGIGGTLEGWNDKPFNVEGVMYDNVARGLVKDESVVAETVKAGEKKTYRCNATFDKVTDPSKCRFIALLINKETGTIENAAMVAELTEPAKNNCSMTVTAPEYADANGKFNATLNFVNLADNEIKQVVVNYTAGSAEAQSATIDTDIAAVDGVGSYDVEISGCPVGVNVPVAVEVVSVNGVNVEAADDHKATFTVSNFDQTKGYDRNVVVEATVSAANGMTPQAIVALAAIADNANVIAVQVHDEDEMAIEAYPATAVEIASATVNRVSAIGAVPAADGYQAAVEAAAKMTAFAKVELTVNATETEGKFTFEPTVEFALDADLTQVEMACAIVENGVGPYNQANDFAGAEGDAALEWWSQQPATVETTFNDVPRAMVKIADMTNGEVTVAKAGEKNPFTCEVTAEKAIDPTKCKFIAMVINKKTGTIENAVATGSFIESSIGSVAANAANGVSVDGATVTFNGEGTAEVYTTSGVCIGSIASGSSLTPAPGIYVVRCGETSIKIAIVK